MGIPARGDPLQLLAYITKYQSFIPGDNFADGIKKKIVSAYAIGLPDDGEP